METIAQRLSLLRGKMTQKSFADLLGIEQTYISRYELGKVKPSTDYYIALATKLNVNINWLITGFGELYISSNTDPEILKENLKLKKELANCRELTKRIYELSKPKK